MADADLEPGYRVELIGLKTAAHLNGKPGHLHSFNEEKQRWKVILGKYDLRKNNERGSFHDGESVLVKPENLQTISFFEKFTKQPSVEKVAEQVEKGKMDPTVLKTISLIQQFGKNALDWEDQELEQIWKMMGMDKIGKELCEELNETEKICLIVQQPAIQLVLKARGWFPDLVDFIPPN